MKLALPYIFFSFLILCIVSCSTDDNVNKDEEKPTISVNYTEGFPKSCTQLLRGETYNFKAKATDDIELASYSLDIHHNFDHHTHDDQGSQCQLEPIKQAINPFIFMENYPIENGLINYEINIALAIPNDIDTGDYHCQFSVTDKTGWQSRTSIDIKIIESN